MSNLNLQCLLGIQCNDFVMIAADQSNAHSIMLMKDGEFAVLVWIGLVSNAENLPFDRFQTKIKSTKYPINWSWA